MKERIIVSTLLAVLAGLAIVAMGNTDLIYVGATLIFFAICIAYAVWCERL